MCQGYYRHAEGYTPEWVGMDRFRGRIVHPQTWPTDLDYAGKNVVVIGSGATAATLIPAIAAECDHVTMLQRSPTFFRTGRNAIEIADELRELQIDETWIHEIVRRKILHDQAVFTRRSFTEPEAVKKELLSAVRGYLGADYDIDTHFTPNYRPWRQRIAFIPDCDFLQAIRASKASVVTDEIETFTESGLLLKSGKSLGADIIVTATGFNLSVLGDIAFAIDGKTLDFADTVTYRGMMFTGVPNMVWVFGYFRASWTLRADLVADFVCRLINHMKVNAILAGIFAVPLDLAVEIGDREGLGKLHPAIALDPSDDVVGRGIEVRPAAMTVEFEFLAMRGHRRHNGFRGRLSAFEGRGGQNAAHDHARVHVPRLRL